MLSRNFPAVSLEGSMTALWYCPGWANTRRSTTATAAVRSASPPVDAGDLPGPLAVTGPEPEAADLRRGKPALPSGSRRPPIRRRVAMLSAKLVLLSWPLAYSDSVGGAAWANAMQWSDGRPFNS